MDCSGTVYHLLTQAGVKDVPRDASEMYKWVWTEGLFRAVVSPNPDTFELKPLKARRSPILDRHLPGRSRSAGHPRDDLPRHQSRHGPPCHGRCERRAAASNGQSPTTASACSTSRCPANRKAIPPSAVASSDLHSAVHRLTDRSRGFRRLPPRVRREPAAEYNGSPRGFHVEISILRAAEFLAGRGQPFDPSP